MIERIYLPPTRGNTKSIMLLANTIKELKEMSKYKIDRISNVVLFPLENECEDITFIREGLKLHEINNDVKSIVRCKDCKFRYDEDNCPLVEYHETSYDDEDWDYWYTYGRSTDDDFFCADGEYSEEWSKE